MHKIHGHIKTLTMQLPIFYHIKKCNCRTFLFVLYTINKYLISIHKFNNIFTFVGHKQDNAIILISLRRDRTFLDIKSKVVNKCS